MKVVILSDIHGNLEALSEVVTYINHEEGIKGMILLGDLIDYGPHSNEVIDMIKKISLPVLCNIWGNHETSVINEQYDSFSSDRGRESAKFTRENLSSGTIKYLTSQMNTSGMQEFELLGKKCLSVHGSRKDVYWTSIFPNQELNEYSVYDYVFSGHSHEPHFFEKYYQTEDSVRRNRKKTIFINPGSIGQPRNINNKAQFAILDFETEELSLKKISYDIEKEIKCFSERIDNFYKDRLRIGV